MAEALGVIIIILAVALIVLVLFQNKGTDLGGFVGGGAGDGGGVQRTRRGVEALLHNVTIGLAAAFFIITLIAFFVWGG